MDEWSKWRDSNSWHPRLRRLLRCPVCALTLLRLRCTQTAATHSGRLAPPPAALPSLPQSRKPALFAECRSLQLSSRKTQREPPARGSSLCVVRTTGFEPAASCSQSKRSTKLSHVRKYIKPRKRESKRSSCCGARYLPCRRSGCVSYRPRPLARLSCLRHRRRSPRSPN